MLKPLNSSSLKAKVANWQCRFELVAGAYLGQQLLQDACLTWTLMTGLRGLTGEEVQIAGVGAQRSAANSCGVQ